ncbi:MAG: hypothetical protein J6X55_09265 [Victivallales bacterium]|nr:hypothetical protein [Victivallales bacterium]
MKPIIEAHRGFSARFPENTMRSFREAIAEGAPSIELDIHSSKDGVLVVMHDESVARTTNGEGNLGDLTLKQIKALDAGSWKDPAFKGEQVPTLEETLQLTDKFGVAFNIEVKRFSSPQQAENLVALIKAHKPAAGRTHVVSSFQADALLQTREAGCDVPLCFLSSDASVALETAKKNHFPWIHLNQNAVTADVVKAAHDAGISVMVWTVNDTTTYDAYYAMGVDKICTNWCKEMLAAERIHIILENERKNGKPSL